MNTLTVLDYDLSNRINIDRLEHYQKTQLESLEAIFFSMEDITHPQLDDPFNKQDLYPASIEIAKLIPFDYEEITFYILDMIQNTEIRDKLYSIWDTLIHINQEMEHNTRKIISKHCIMHWLTLESPLMILGGIFTYYDPDTTVPYDANINNTKMYWGGKNFVYMQGIGANIYLILAKMISDYIGYDNPWSKVYINDYLPQAVIDFTSSLGINLIFVNPIGIQKHALLSRGFQAITDTRDAHIIFDDSCLPPSAGEQGIYRETLYYEI